MTGLVATCFVMARFNESMIEKPELEDLPELPEGAEPAAEAEPETEAEQGETEAAKTKEAESASEPAVDPETSTEEPSAEEEEEEETSETDSEADVGDDEANAEAEASEEASADSSAGEEETTPEESEEDKVTELIAQREAIEKENQRKLDEYQDKLKAGKERVRRAERAFRRLVLRDFQRCLQKDPPQPQRCDHQKGKRRKPGRTSPWHACRFARPAKLADQRCQLNLRAQFAQ